MNPQLHSRHFPYERLTIRQAAEAAGVSAATIRKAIERGELTSHESLVRMVAVDSSDLLRWIEARPSSVRAPEADHVSR